jgi:hypothetical protein
MKMREWNGHGYQQYPWPCSFVSRKPQALRRKADSTPRPTSGCYTDPCRAGLTGASQANNQFGGGGRTVPSTTDSSDRLVPAAWTARLADAIAASLREFAPQLQGSEVVLLQVTCLPWHGLLGLAILTAEEFAEDARLADPRRTMDWQHGEFTEEVEAWGPTAALAQEMRAAYYGSSDCPAAALAFLRACARAAAAATVVKAVSLLERADGFRVSVPHPDDGREFFPSEAAEPIAAADGGQTPLKPKKGRGRKKPGN